MARGGEEPGVATRGTQLLCSVAGEEDTSTCTCVGSVLTTHTRSGNRCAQGTSEGRRGLPAVNILEGTLH